jgi:DNA-binding PadR family transcriptional regulator
LNDRKRRRYFHRNRDTTSQGVDLLSLGGLYTTVARMEDEGLVRSRWGSETSETLRGARRRYYRITPHGERALAATQKT